MDTLDQEIARLIESSVYDAAVRSDFAYRLGQGKLTRDENPASHVSVYFLPHNRAFGTVFLVAHKKSGLWLAPGGHVDAGETLLQTLNREISEELGVRDFFHQLPQPFLLSTVDIDRQNHSCRKHYDVWFLVETDGKNFQVDPSEFHETRWVNRQQALELLEDPSNIQAVKKVLAEPYSRKT